MVHNIIHNWKNCVMRVIYLLFIPSTVLIYLISFYTFLVRVIISSCQKHFIVRVIISSYQKHFKEILLAYIYILTIYCTLLNLSILMMIINSIIFMCLIDYQLYLNYQSYYWHFNV